MGEKGRPRGQRQRLYGANFQPFSAATETAARSAPNMTCLGRAGDVILYAETVLALPLGGLSVSSTMQYKSSSTMTSVFLGPIFRLRMPSPPKKSSHCPREAR